MAGRHLRGARRPDRRDLFGALVVLLVGLAIGAAWSLLTEDRAEREAVDATDDGSELEETAAVLRPEPGPVTIALVGDLRAEGAVATRLAEGPDDLLGSFAPVLRDAQLAVASLDTALVQPEAEAEGPVGPDGRGAPASLLDALVAGGVDVVSAANDRVLGSGTEGLYGLLGVKAARDDGVIIGVGVDEAEAYAPFVRDVGGQRVAVIAATQVLAADRIADLTAGPATAGLASAKRVDRLRDQVVAASSDADTVVVVLRWGSEGDICPGPGQQELAAALVAAGADVVVGAGAGRLQGAGWLGDAVVGYGLGGFLGTDHAETGALLVRVEGDAVVGYEWVPGRVVDGVPTVLVGDEAEVARADWDSRRDCTGLAP